MNFNDKWTEEAEVNTPTSLYFKQIYTSDMCLNYCQTEIRESMFVYGSSTTKC